MIISSSLVDSLSLKSTHEKGENMRRVVVSVHECESGMKVAESIYNDYGAVVIAENTILDAHLIKKIVNLGIEKIKIYDQDQNIISANSSEMFHAQYNQNVEIVKDILHDISTGKDVDIDKINVVSDSVFVRINENRDIINCMNQIRGTDEYTYSHCVNVSLFAMLIGKWLKMDSGKIKLLVQAGLLHDIGKSKVPNEILNKPGPLTKEEFEEMKKHTVYGYRIVEKMPHISKDVLMGVLMHHEREDGSGYPVGAKGSQIHEFAKVIAVADIYDAMTSNRVYRERESPFEVFELMENKSFGYLDPVAMNVFLSNISAYYIGDTVLLNTGDKAEVVYINQRHFSRPVVKIENIYVDLTIEKDVKVLKLV